MWLLRQMLDSHGSIEAFFTDGADPDAETVEDALDAFSRRACALDLQSVYGRSRPKPGVALLLRAAVELAARASG